MIRLLSRCAAVAGLALAAGAFGGGGPASAEAVVIDCGLFAEGTDGVIIITPNEQVRANCHHHFMDGSGGSSGGGSTFIDCAEVLGDADGPGVSVTTPSGNTLTNCHVHEG